MGATPTYAIPYPELADPANGPVQIKALADRLEALLASSGQFFNPAGTVYAYAGAVAPGGYALCDGASYLRSAQPTLFAAIGTTHGAADGTHFNVPDYRGLGLVGAGQGVGLTARTLGAKGGAEKVGLALGDMPNHNHGGVTGTDSPDHVHALTVAVGVASITVGAESAYHTHHFADWWRPAVVSPDYPAGNAVPVWDIANQAGLANAASYNTSNEASTHIHAASDNGHVHSASAGGASARHSHSVSAQGSGTPHENMGPFGVVNWIIKL